MITQHVLVTMDIITIAPKKIVNNVIVNVTDVVDLLIIVMPVLIQKKL